MPVIRISDETMGRLKTWAGPLVDTAESALAKVLDAAETARSDPPPADPPMHREPPVSEPPARSGGGGPRKLPQKAFRQPLLESIYELGGSAHTRELRPVVKERVKPLLLPGDLEFVSTGEERWWNATGWERSALVKEGYLSADSPRGTWALSDKGTEHVVNSRRTRPPGPFVEHLLAIPDAGDDADFDRDPSSFRHVEL